MTMAAILSPNELLLHRPWAIDRQTETTEEGR
jgi:hypothetical protein